MSSLLDLASGKTIESAESGRNIMVKRIFTAILAVITIIACSISAMASEAPHTDTETIRQVQEALNSAGYNCGTPDGDAGANTSAAIQQYR